MTATMGLQATPTACEPESVALVAAEKKIRRKFRRIALGPTIEVSSGRVERWGTEEEEDRRGFVHQRRVRLLDENGFPTTGITGWVETSRSVSEPITIKFEEGAPLPAMIRTASQSERRRFPNECAGGFRLIYAEPPRPSKPELKWFPASDEKRRKEFLAELLEAPPEIKEALDAPPPELEPAPDQWFRVELSQAMYNKGAWEEYPNGWCAKLVSRSTEVNDPDWTYVQLSFHFNVWYEGEDGRLSSRQKTDRADSGSGRVQCGIWIPHWLLVPISAGEAVDIYDVLAAQVAAETN